MARFKDRIEAANELLPKLLKYKDDINAVVIGLPRGGIITASVIAKGLKLPLGFLVVKKLGAPGDSELAIGAVTDNGGTYLDERLISVMGIDSHYVDDEIEKRKEEARQKAEYYASIVGVTDFSAKTVILVDDGIATGSTMIAAIRSAKKHGARKVVVAFPAGSCDPINMFRDEADEVICLHEKLDLSSVGEYYGEFPQVSDEEVVGILKSAN